MCECMCAHKHVCACRGVLCYFSIASCQHYLSVVFHGFFLEWSELQGQVLTLLSNLLEAVFHYLFLIYRSLFLLLFLENEGPVRS